MRKQKKGEGSKKMETKEERNGLQKRRRKRKE